MSSKRTSTGVRRLAVAVADLCRAVHLHTTQCPKQPRLNAATAPYTDPAFGRWQNAESILFYAGCLALLGRSKIFNDDGHQFVDGLTRSGAKLGRGWANIFAADGLAPPEGADVGERAARCKKSYPWNLLGDCTLPLHHGT